MNQTYTYPSSVPEGTASSPLRVLVLDDSAADAERTIDELRKSGFDCRSRVIHTRKEFLAELIWFPYDLVLAAYQLPGWTGMNAFADMRNAGRDSPFILITGTLGDEVAVECIRQGITDYVLKDHLTRLPLVVERALGEKSRCDAHTFMVDDLRKIETNLLFF